MAEVFQGTPCIVTVAISDPEGRKVEFNVCGRDLSEVKQAVWEALHGLPENGLIEPKKAHQTTKRKRRTKAEIAATVTPAEPERETATAGAGKKETSWP